MRAFLRQEEAADRVIGASGCGCGFVLTMTGKVVGEGGSLVVGVAEVEALRYEREDWALDTAVGAAGSVAVGARSGASVGGGRV